MFAGVAQNQEVLQLRDRVEELEIELRSLQSQKLNPNEKAALDQQMQVFAQQLAAQGGEHLIPIDQIQSDPNQPRTVFPTTVISARAKSLREDGQLSPIILIPQEKGYRLFDGEVRWRSAPLAEMEALRAVFLTQEALKKLDKIALFDHQLVTSLQSEKLHPFDLANALVKLIVARYPALGDQIANIPSLLNAVIQRLRRSGQIAELEEIMIKDEVSQSRWIETVCRPNITDETNEAEAQRQILSTILDKQLNPITINSNVFTLLNLPDDLQVAIRTEGLEGSKILELKKLSAKNLEVGEVEAAKIRTQLTQDVIEQKLSLEQIRKQVKALIQSQKTVKEQSQQVLSQRLVEVPKRLKQAKVWMDSKKKVELEKLLDRLEKLLD